MIDHVVGDSVRNAGSQASIPDMCNGDRFPGFCPAFRSLLLPGKPTLQSGSLFLSSLEFNFLDGRQIVEPASAVCDRIYDPSIHSKHFLLSGIVVFGRILPDSKLKPTNHFPSGSCVIDICRGSLYSQCRTHFRMPRILLFVPINRQSSPSHVRSVKHSLVSRTLLTAPLVLC